MSDITIKRGSKIAAMDAVYAVYTAMFQGLYDNWNPPSRDVQILRSIDGLPILVEVVETGTLDPDSDREFTLVLLEKPKISKVDKNRGGV